MRQMIAVVFVMLVVASLVAAVQGNWPFAVWAMVSCLLCILIDLGGMLLRILKLLDEVHTMGISKLTPEEIHRVLRTMRK